MRDACTSPGSRSTPLVLSLTSEERLRCHSHVDERCAGFFALGLAKASAVPVAIACTSGTAVAELLPAVVEAHEARVPLIVLSADRPPELREVGAGQTIDQLKIFGGFAKWFFEVGTHEATPERVRWMRTLACRAVATTLEARPGVVHLNFPLREPLVCEQAPPPPGEGRRDGRPVRASRPRRRADPTACERTGDTRDCSCAIAASSVARPPGGGGGRALRARHAARRGSGGVLRGGRLAATGRPALGRAARGGSGGALRRAAAPRPVRRGRQARPRAARR